MDGKRGRMGAIHGGVAEMFIEKASIACFKTSEANSLSDEFYTLTIAPPRLRSGFGKNRAGSVSPKSGWTTRGRPPAVRAVAKNEGRVGCAACYLLLALIPHVAV